MEDNASTIKVLVDFLYSDKVDAEVLRDNQLAIDLMGLAEQFLIPTLKSVCERVIQKKI